MTQIQVDPGLQRQLGGMAEPVVLCDPSGKVLGHFLPEEQYQKMLYASIKIPYSEEELARREAETGGSTLEEIWNKLGRR